MEYQLQNKTKNIYINQIKRVETYYFFVYNTYLLLHFFNTQKIIMKKNVIYFINYLFLK